MAVVRRIALAGVLLLALTLVLDSLLRKGQSSEVKLDLELTSNAEARSTLIVYLPGILAGARSSSQGFSDIWRANGDVLYVEYEGKRFRAKQVVSKVVRFIDSHNSYKRILLIGSSMGGLLDRDLVQRTRWHNTWQGRDGGHRRADFGR